METQLIAFLTSPTAAAFGVMTAAIAAMGYALWVMVKRERERISIDRDAEDLKAAVRRVKTAVGALALETAEDRRDRLTTVVLNQRMPLAEQGAMGRDLAEARLTIEGAIEAIKAVYADVNALTNDGTQYVSLSFALPTSAGATGGYVSTAQYSTALDMKAKQRIVNFLNRKRGETEFGPVLKGKSNDKFLGICYRFAVENDRKDGDFFRLSSSQMTALLAELKKA